MTQSQNDYDSIKKPIANSIPFSNDEKATKKFNTDLSFRLMEISDSIDDTKSLKTCKDALLYKPGTQSGSHVGIHMPTDGSSSSKINAQVSAMNKMLYNNKTTNSCFTNEKDGYKLIVNVLNDKTHEITHWLQSNYQGDYNVVVTTNEINNLIDLSQDKYDKLGYGFTKDERGHIDAFESKTMTVVLRKNEPEDDNPLGFNGLGFHVYTAYPGQRQNELYTELNGVTPMPDEDVSNIVKKTAYYKIATDMQKTCLMMQSTKKINIPSQLSVYYDRYGDAIVITAPPYKDKTDSGALQYAQKRYFIKKSDDKTQKTVISAAKYTKDINDNSEVWHREQALPYPDCVPETLKPYLDKTQNRVNRCLTSIETKRIQQNEINKEEERNAEELKAKAALAAADAKKKQIVE